MCAYKTIRAAKPPQEAMKAFEEILYGLMKLSNVPQAKQYLEGGLQHVNISSESASLKYMDEGAAVRVPTYLAEKCSLEAVHHCGNKTMSYSAHLVSSVLCLVKRLTEISTRVMRSSAEELVCGFVQLFRAESESSKPPELRKHLDTLGSVFGCFKRPSKWTTWMKTTQCEGYSYWKRLRNQHGAPDQTSHDCFSIRLFRLCKLPYWAISSANAKFRGCCFNIFSESEIRSTSLCIQEKFQIQWVRKITSEEEQLDHVDILIMCSLFRMCEILQGVH